MLKGYCFKLISTLMPSGTFKQIVFLSGLQSTAKATSGVKVAVIIKTKIRDKKNFFIKANN
ncbi:hypothetical protein HZA71_01390 [Candidatus Falkowbacteria bacterium]|nr:hypothetical protein [Candidatus Falkowbacteria bacterium]